VSSLKEARDGNFKRSIHVDATFTFRFETSFNLQGEKLKWPTHPLK